MLEPTWKLEDRADGPTLVVGGYTMHPGDYPRRMARLQAMEAASTVMKQNGKRVVLIGFGLGYLAKELLHVLPPDVPLLIWDCLPVATIERSEALREIEKRAKILHLEEEVLLCLDGDTYVVPHASAVDLFCWEISLCESEFNRRQAKTMKAVSKRSAEFLQWLPKVGLVQEHYGLGKGRTAVIVAPGPTMDVDKLKRLQELKYPIICCAQALKKLNDAGVTPTVTVCLDPQPAIYDSLAAGKDPGWVYVDAMSDGRIFAEFTQKIFAYTVPTSHCHALVWREMGYDWMDVSSVTVSEMMLEIAWKMGFHSVVTSGVDYYSKERTERMKLECKGGVWSDAHYYGGSKAWRYMSRLFSLPTLPAEDFFARKMEMAQMAALELPPPSSKIPAALVNFHLQQMLGQQPDKIQEELLKQIPEGCRADFAPINGVGVPVIRQS